MAYIFSEPGFFFMENWC